MKATKNILAAALFVCIAAVGLAGCYGDYWDNAPVLEDLFEIYTKSGSVYTSPTALHISTDYYVRIGTYDKDDDLSKIYVQRGLKNSATSYTEEYTLQQVSTAPSSNGYTCYYVPLKFDSSIGAGDWNISVWLSDDNNNKSDTLSLTRTVEN